MWNLHCLLSRHRLHPTWHFKTCLHGWKIIYFNKNIFYSYVILLPPNQYLELVWDTNTQIRIWIFIIFSIIKLKSFLFHYTQHKMENCFKKETISNFRNFCCHQYFSIEAYNRTLLRRSKFKRNSLERDVFKFKCDVTVPGCSMWNESGCCSDLSFWYNTGKDLSVV